MLGAAQALSSVTTVEVISDAAGFAAMRPEWTRLLADSDSDCLFLTWEWLHTWWQHLAADRRLRLLAVRDGDQLIAVAPFGLNPRFRSGHPLRTLEFLGSGHVGSDYLDVIARRGYESAATEALADFLARQPYSLKFTNVRPGAVVDGLARELSGLQWTVRQTPTNVCPYIPLAGESWDSYLASLGAEHRYNFRRKYQRLHRDFAVRLDEARSTTEAREMADLVIHLHNLRWSAGAERSDAFHTPGLVAFHQDFAPLAFDRGWLRIYVLRLNDRPAACLYGFLYGGKFYFYQSGFDPAYAPYSTGMLTMGLAIRQAIEEGVTEFDLLHGDESYKAHWASGQRDLCRLELYPANLGGRLSRVSVAAVRGVRKVARRVLNTAR